jgi:hypothetical protein
LPSELAKNVEMAENEGQPGDLAMSTLLLILALSAAPATEAAPAADCPSSAAGLRRSVHECLQRWARPDDSQLDQAARELLALFNRLVEDRELAPASRKELILKVRSRLASWSARIAARGERGTAGPGAPPSIRLPGRGAQAMAQRVPAGGAQAGAFHSAADDAGDDLVELIQRTIAPGSWDVNGGPGAIRLWRPGRALVVYGNGDAHERLGGLFGQMRKAGR